jgi:hypothetical protein
LDRPILGENGNRNQPKITQNEGWEESYPALQTPLYI